MKRDAMLENTAKALSGVDVGGKKNDPELAALDRGILTVALMIAGLDGVILPGEYAAFGEMAKRCRGATAKNTRALFNEAICKAGPITAMAQSGLFTESSRLAMFVRLANEALPKGFACGSVTDLRRAFALWIAMGVSDGSFSGFESRCVHTLVRRFALARAGKAKRFSALIEPSFFAKAERIFRAMSVASTRTKAEKDLIALIAASAEPTVKQSLRISPKKGSSLNFAQPGPTIPGWR